MSGETLERKAIGIEEGGRTFLGITLKAPDYEEAVKTYQQAAGAYNDENNAAKAGEMWEAIAEIHEKEDNEIDMLQAWQEASKCYRKVLPYKAAEFLQKVVKHYQMQSNTRQACTKAEKLAELYEKDVLNSDPNPDPETAREKRLFAKATDEDKEKKAKKKQERDAKKASAVPNAIRIAMEWYKQTGDWYDRDNSEVLANKNYIKYADMSASIGDYYPAIEKYENAAKMSIDRNPFNVKVYLLKAGICHLCTDDMVGMRRALQNYLAIDRTFERTHDYQLLVQLTDAVEARDQEAFDAHREKFTNFVMMDTWKTSLLDRVQAKLGALEYDFA